MVGSGFANRYMMMYVLVGACVRLSYLYISYLRTPNHSCRRLGETRRNATSRTPTAMEMAKPAESARWTAARLASCVGFGVSLMCCWCVLWVGWCLSVACGWVELGCGGGDPTSIYMCVYGGVDQPPGRIDPVCGDQHTYLLYTYNNQKETDLELDARGQDVPARL